MKKIIMVVLLLVGIGLAGGGYYMFYYKPQQEAAMAEEEVDQPVMQPIQPPDDPQVVEEKPPVTDYYVSPERLGVRERPDANAFIESVVYRGDKLHILEKKEGWGRISPYYVYEDGGEEVAEWVPMDALLEVAPTITKEERVKTISGYIENSDDFKQYFDVLIESTDKLLKEGTCTPEDFEETSGWMRSVTFSERDVYFVYCGGLKQANKIYLDVQTKETFYR